MSRRPNVTRAPKTRKVRKPYTNIVEEVAVTEEQSSAPVDYGTQLKRIADALTQPSSLEPVLTAIAEQIDKKQANYDLGRIDERLKVLETNVNTILATPPRLLSRVEKLEAAVAAHEASLREAGTPILSAVEPATEVVTPANGVEAPKKRRGRPTNAELAARKAAETGTPAEVVGETGPVIVEEPLVSPAVLHEAAHAPVPEVITTPAPVPVKPAAPVDEEARIQAFVEARPGVKASEVMKEFKCSFNRATAYVEAWGTVSVGMDTVKAEEKKPVVTPAAQQMVEVKKAEPAAPPSADDVRAVALQFIAKHPDSGKAKLADMLKKYGAGNLSGVPEEQRAALMSELQAGV